MATLIGNVGQTLRCSFEFEYKGPEADVWVGLFLGKHTHLELGLWPKIGFWAHVGESYGWVRYYTADVGFLDVPITSNMMGRTFDVLRVVARTEIADNAGNLAADRFDDDWDDAVLAVPTIEAEAHIFEDIGVYEIV